MKLILFLILIGSVFAQGSIYTSEYLLINLNITGGFTISPEGQTARTDYVLANISFVPHDGYNQEVLSLESNPPAEFLPESILFRWDTPSLGSHTYNVFSQIRTLNRHKPLKEKIQFPLADIPENLQIYLRPSDTIDSDHPSIIAQANQLAAGHDDLYFVVHALADWVERNIEYDLSTVTADVAQTSSWVLENREGVCDELTNLFIGMLRAIGIPARFASGISYTNSPLFTEKWGPHGWAEVYFGPEIGWVPWDVTYGEFGFIDPTHITLKESLDATDSSAHYQWLGSSIALATKPLNFSVSLVSTEGQTPDLFDVSVEVVQPNTGFSSHNLVIARIRNLQDIYQSITLTLSKSREVELLDPATKHLALLPNGEGVMTWLLKVSDTLDSSYIYTLPVLLTTTTNHTYTGEFTVRNDGPIFSQADFATLTQSYAEESLRRFSSEFTISCTKNASGIYVDQQLSISCTVSNNGNQQLSNIKVCLKTCETLTLGISQSKQVTFIWKPSTVGQQTLLITADGTELHKTASLNVLVWDYPRIAFQNLNYSSEVGYTDQFPVTFDVLLPKGSSPLKDVTLMLSWEGAEQAWTLEQLERTQSFDVKLLGKNLQSGVNLFELSAQGKDLQGKEFRNSTSFTISLTNLTILQKITVFFRSLERKIQGWFYP